MATPQTRHCTELVHGPRFRPGFVAEMACLARTLPVRADAGGCGVIERARAKWEDEPRYPARARPVPPARRRARPEQGAAQVSMAEGGSVQQQLEALRLF